MNTALINLLSLFFLIIAFMRAVWISYLILLPIIRWMKRWPRFEGIRGLYRVGQKKHGWQMSFVIFYRKCS